MARRCRRTSPPSDHPRISATAVAASLAPPKNTWVGVTGRGATMTLAADQLMLTLAGLAYRGFQDALPGEPHEVIVRRAVLDGLGTLAPVQGAWELAWGPVTSPGPIGAFDSSAMYVVRSRVTPRRLIVAVRGTNPI